MEVFVGRQPILVSDEEVFAYELLYRNNTSNNSFSTVDGDQATTEVMINSFFNMGMIKVSEGKPCFINFTENLLMQHNLASCFPPD